MACTAAAAQIEAIERAARPGLRRGHPAAPRTHARPLPRPGPPVRPPRRDRRRRRPGRPRRQPLPHAARRRPRRARTRPRPAQLARRPLGRVQPRHAELAVRAARPSVPGRRPRRLHGQGRDPRLRRAVRDTASRSTRASPSTPSGPGSRSRRATARSPPTRSCWRSAATTSRSIPDHGLPGIHSSRYRNPESLPDGPVLVVGTGQSGAQIAEDLHLAGRDRAPRGRHRPARRPLLPRPRLRRLAAGHGPLRPAGHRAPAGQGHAQGGQPLRHGPRRRARPRPARVRGRRPAPARPAHARRGRDAALRRRPRPPTSTPPTRRWSGSRTASTATSRPTASTPRTSPATRRVWEPPTDGSGTLAAEAFSTIVWATGFRSDWSFVHAPEAFDARRLPGAPPRRHAGRRACTSSACRGCTPGARVASRGSPATPSTWPPRSRPAASLPRPSRAT